MFLSLRMKKRWKISFLASLPLVILCPVECCFEEFCKSNFVDGSLFSFFHWDCSFLYWFVLSCFIVWGFMAGMSGEPFEPFRVAYLLIHVEDVHIFVFPHGVVEGELVSV